MTPHDWVPERPKNAYRCRRCGTVGWRASLRADGVVVVHRRLAGHAVYDDCDLEAADLVVGS